MEKFKCIQKYAHLDSIMPPSNIIIANHSPPMVPSMAILFCDITKPLENNIADIVHCIHVSESGAKQN